MSWLPAGKSAALCFSVDDVHPSTSSDPYEAGGDLSRGTLGFVERLLERHRRLQVTLFVTPDWRPVQLVTSRAAARLPVLGRYVYHVDLHRRGRFRLDRHPRFVRYLKGLSRAEIAPHGLHHVHRGSNLAVEFQGRSLKACLETVRRSLSIFDAAGIEPVRGFAPPGWDLPDPLMRALTVSGFRFVASARDIDTAVSPDAQCRMSGIGGVSLVQPQWIHEGHLVHIPTNFQATSDAERARQILDCHGLVSIKAHAFKEGGGHVQADGLDRHYFQYLDGLFEQLDHRYGDALWWTSMSEIAQRFHDVANTAPAACQSKCSKMSPAAGV
jgi:Uncharacterized protein conserved in bacteria (DUF2334)